MGTIVHVDLLLGRKILNKQGKPIGRIEELAAEQEGEELIVTAVLVGPLALFDRLSLPTLGRAILRVLSVVKRPRGYRVDWNQIDLSDPDHPRLVCDERDIRRA